MSTESVDPVKATTVVEKSAMDAVHCIVETDPDAGAFVGWVVGFRHFAVTGETPDEVEDRLRSQVLGMHESGSLVLESEFVRTFIVELPQA